MFVLSLLLQRKYQRKQAPIGLLRPIGEARRCLGSSLLDFMALVLLFTSRTQSAFGLIHRIKTFQPIKTAKRRHQWFGGTAITVLIGAGVFPI